MSLKDKAKEVSADIKKYIAEPTKEYGEYITELDGTQYWLTRKEADTWWAKNDEIKDDAEFNAWWEGWKKSLRLVPRRAYANWGSWSDDGSTDKSWWSKNILSSWGSSDKERKLALAMQRVATAVRIIDDSIPPLTIEWSNSATSATSLAENKCVINPKPVVEQKTNGMTDEEVIRVVTGLGLHEASHSNPTWGTRPREVQLLKPKKLQPVAIAGFLANLIEDLRIERQASADYPGFASMFDDVAAYMWTLHDEKNNPAQWDTLKECLNALVMHWKWPDKAAEILKDPSFAAELPWWDEWNDRYQSGAANLRDTIEQGLERLRKSNEENGHQPGSGEGPTGTEGEEGSGGRDRKNEMDLSNRSDGDSDDLADRLGTEHPCTNHTAGKDRLDAKEAERIQRLVQEGLEELKAKLYAEGCAKPRIWHRRPLEDAESRAAYVAKPSGLVERYKNALKFRPELPRYSNRLLKNGVIDDDQLWRFGAKDYRVFEKKVIEEYPTAHVCLLVDMSGSMSGEVQYEGRWREKVFVAQELAQLFLRATLDMEGVEPMVLGHTGDCAFSRGGDGSGSAEFLTLWEPGDPITRLGLITSMQHGNNYDGYAIEWAADRLMSVGQPDDTRLIIVLSDGHPAGHDYGHESAFNHVSAVVKSAEKNGVIVVQVAIDDSLIAANQSRMFRLWTHFTTADALPAQLAKVVSGILSAFSE